MLRKWADPRGRIFTIGLGLLAAVLVLFIVLYPERAFRSSLGGLTLWWELVFPALLPFLILSELVTGFGFVHALGEWISPPLRYLFRLPGAGGWAMAVGLIAGYPGGAESTARLRSGKLISRESAGRLLALSHLGNPVTIVTVIGVGMLHSPEAGLLLAIIHYIAAIVAAVLLSLLPSRQATASEIAGEERRPDSGSLLRRSLKAMREARQRDGRTFGKLLGDAVLASIQTLLMVGGFMMIFAVFNQVVQLAVPGISASRWVSAAATGLLEPHLGAFAFAKLWPGGPVLLPLAAIGAVLGWSGLSLHAQVGSFARSAGISLLPFLQARILHAVSAFALTFALWNPLTELLGGSAKETAAIPTAAARPTSYPSDPLEPLAYWRGIHQLPALLEPLLAVFAVLVAVSIIVRLLRRG